MVVHFPGLNAPIPHDADKRIWGSSADGSGRHQGYINDDLDSATRDSDRRSSRAHSPSRDRTSTRKSSMRTHSPSRDRSSSRQPSPHLSRTSSDSARSPKASYDESYSLLRLAGPYLYVDIVLCIACGCITPHPEKPKVTIGLRLC